MGAVFASPHRIPDSVSVLDGHALVWHLVTITAEAARADISSRVETGSGTHGGERHVCSRAGNKLTVGSMLSNGTKEMEECNDRGNRD
ncbi:MAG: hypothetical protein ACRDJT_12960, partial [Actinomycetota bacterium]